MSLSDPIGDMLTRIRNAVAADHDTVDIPASRIKGEIARVLKDEGYIQKYEITDAGTPGALLKITLRYGPRRKPIISGLRRASKPGRRLYVGWQDIPRVQGGLGVAILTTSRGLITDRQARAEKIGGEVLALVW